MKKLRILHTSDWHIGQRLHGRDRTEEHERFFTWLLETIRVKAVDVLIVAGDIFDVGYPSNSALQHYYQFLVRCKQTGCRQIVITGGNHDYISTLNAPQSILNALNIDIIGGATNSINDEVIALKNNNEETAAYLCAVPYLRDKDIRKAIAGESHDDRLKAIRDGIALHYQQVNEVAKSLNSNNLPVLATGHLYMAGVKLSESERDVQMGNQAGFEWDAFPHDFDYVALGHIHRPQRIAQQEHVRYSGSPIPLSFSEKSDRKQVVLIEVDGKDKVDITPIEVPSPRRLISFTGTLEEVKAKLNNHISLTDLKDWTEIIVTEESYEPSIITNYREMIAGEYDVEVIKPSITFNDRQKNLSSLYEEQPSLSDLNDFEVFEKLLDRSDSQKDDELVNTYKQLIQEMNEE